MKREIKLNKVYRHFKGKFYRTFYEYNSDNIKDKSTIDLSNYMEYGVKLTMESSRDDLVTLYVGKWDSEEEMPILVIDKDNKVLEGNWIIYQALYDQYLFWIREKSIFLSKVDTNKYPNEKQKYRFEEVK